MGNVGLLLSPTRWSSRLHDFPVDSMTDKSYLWTTVRVPQGMQALTWKEYTRIYRTTSVGLNSQSIKHLSSLKQQQNCRKQKNKRIQKCALDIPDRFIVHVQLQRLFRFQAVGFLIVQSFLLVSFYAFNLKGLESLSVPI